MSEVVMEIAKIILEYIKVLIWPSIALILLSYYHKEIRAILKNFKKLNLPGGTSVEAFPDELKEARTLSEEVKAESRKEEKRASIPLTEANARMIDLGLTPSPSGLELTYYHNLSTQDPNLALAGLRIEAEIMLKNLSKGFKLSLDDKASALLIARKLYEAGNITSRQHELIGIVIRLCNSAVHGQKITAKQANQLFDITSVLVDDYISWLSWGFKDRLK